MISYCKTVGGWACASINSGRTLKIAGKQQTGSNGDAIVARGCIIVKSVSPCVDVELHHAGRCLKKIIQKRGRLAIKSNGYSSSHFLLSVNDL